LKKLLHWLLLFISALLLYHTRQGDAVAATGKHDKHIGITGNRQHYELTTAWPGDVSSADNRVSHHNLTPAPEKSETDEKRRKQLIFHTLSCFEFSNANSLIHNSLQSSRRQPYFYSILKENGQLRL